ncbi:phosphoribosylglycinamide formyltransferase [Deltaproteobacteria bacterium OttesenSCG-928-M10]|nr:phosphoribosylglycinamide formyltransferase [Deltaproteobacteria bacterium OttesenSCG-928-M10]
MSDPKRPLRLGILVSGRGSNMAAILKAIGEGRVNAAAALAVSDNPAAPALGIASAHGVKTVVVNRKSFPDKASFEAAMVCELKEAGVELVVLAGFMRLLGPVFIGEFPDRIINVHPALLPAFPGLEAQKQALDYGVKIAGCTVHYVNEIMDGGRIIAQAAVPVMPDDTAETLSARILEQEHRLLPEVIGRLAVEVAY